MSNLDHEDLWRACRCLPADYAPWGEAGRDAAAAQGRLDCSSGCRWYLKLAGPLGRDWGVCSNHDSPRGGLLTFEHQGCWCYEPEDRDET